MMVEARDQRFRSRAGADWLSLLLRTFEVLA